jgi:L-ribulose-5-phosphate 4-epimerase
MARHTLVLQPAANAPRHPMDRHYRRKHGPDAYYGNLGAEFTTPK